MQKNIIFLTIKSLIFLLFLSSCNQQQLQNLQYHNITLKNQLRLEFKKFSQFKDWNQDNHKDALQAFLHSCRKFSKMSQKKIIDDNFNITAGDFRDVCDIAEVVKTMDDKQAKIFFENYFIPFLVVDNEVSKVNFTGYYQPQLIGSRVKKGKFIHPIYKKPKNLDSKKPFFTREEIANQALSGDNLELLYVDDAIDLFFAHIQGSARVITEDGEIIRIGFAANNGHKYSSIGKYLLDNNLIKPNQANTQDIKKYLKNNPSQANLIMNQNKSFIFFKINDNENVIGSQGVPLTAERSLAIDNNFIPFGLPIWLETTMPKIAIDKMMDSDLLAKNNKINKIEQDLIDKITKNSPSANFNKNSKDFDNKKEKPPINHNRDQKAEINNQNVNYNHLLISQDSGSAIKGRVRGDIYFGNNIDSEFRASYLASKGKYYLLLPIAVVNKIEAIDSKR